MRGPLLSIAGAAASAVLAGLLAVGFLRWRASEQAQLFAADVAACQRGDHSACDQLGAACSQRSGAACAALADLYLSGNGVPQSQPEAVRLLREACGYRIAAACGRAEELEAQTSTAGSPATEDHRQ